MSAIRKEFRLDVPEEVVVMASGAKKCNKFLKDEGFREFEEGLSALFCENMCTVNV